MLALAASEPNIPVDPQELDVNAWLLNLRNGTLDLRTGKLGGHDRRYLITKMAPVEYDPKADCPQWISFLDRVFAGDNDLIRFLQRSIGYSLTGNTGEQIMFICYGLGANGKSTLMEIIRNMLGEYSLHTSFTTFLAKDKEVIRNDLARLAGARFVSSVELRAGQHLDEVAVKQVTGSDTIAARFLYREYFEFRPVFKLWLAANHLPIIKGLDEAIWRRIALIPFNVTIPVAERDSSLIAKMQGEISGILNWAIDGCLDWQAFGLNPPESVYAATAEYRAKMDTLGDFLAECCISAEGVSITSRELYERYTRWCDENGEKSIDQRWFGRNLADKGYRRGRTTGGQRTWEDIDITD